MSPISNSSQTVEETVCGIISSSASIVLVIASILGIIGNLLSFIVFCFPSMRSQPINILLAGQCVSDLVTLAVSIFVFAFQGINLLTGNEKLNEISVYTSVYSYPIALMARSMSIWITVANTMERYIAVCRPLMARKYCTSKKTNGIMLLIVCCSFGFNFIRFFEHRVIVLDSVFTENISFITTTELILSNDFYYYFYYTALFFITHGVIPLCVILISNVCIIRTIRLANKERKKISCSSYRSNNRTKDRVTLMICTITGIFVTVNIGPFILNIVELMHRDLFLMENTRHIAYSALDICNALVTVGSALNFPIFYYFCSSFRNIFNQKICGRRETTNNFILRYTLRGSRNGSYFDDPSNGIMKMTRSCNAISSTTHKFTRSASASDPVFAQSGRRNALTVFSTSRYRAPSVQNAQYHCGQQLLPNKQYSQKLHVPGLQHESKCL